MTHLQALPSPTFPTCDKLASIVISKDFSPDAPLPRGQHRPTQPIHLKAIGTNDDEILDALEQFNWMEPQTISSGLLRFNTDPDVMATSKKKAVNVLVQQFTVPYRTFRLELTPDPAVVKGPGPARNVLVEITAPSILTASHALRAMTRPKRLALIANTLRLNLAASEAA